MRNRFGMIYILLWLMAFLVGYVGPGSTASATELTDELVQPPHLEGSERGSVAGAYSATNFGPLDVTRGSFSLSLPLVFPSQRGQILANIVPQYSSDAGLSEWGMGWQAGLSIQRHAVTGDIDYEGTTFTSPWGRLVKGNDGFYYTAGLRQAVRLSFSSDEWVATLPDGTVFHFKEKLETAAGTYAWYLTEATSILEAKTTLSYLKEPNRPVYLQSVRYGPKDASDTYLVQFIYEELAQPFDRYDTGERIRLDRRVTQISVAARSNGNGAHMLRWQYELEYMQTEVSPAFFLVRIEKTFQSGMREPAAVFSYDTGLEQLQNNEFEVIPALDDYLRQEGSAGIQPTDVAYLDVDRDGRMDLEHHRDQQLIRQTDMGWITEDLLSEPLAVARCRPGFGSYNLPRRLVHMFPGAEAPHVVTMSAVNDAELTICNRAGQVLFTERYQGNWNLNSVARVVDVNRDQRPDIIRLWSGGYQIIENRSSADGFEFVMHPKVSITPSATLHGFWVHDINGDGLVDLVARTDGFVVVWYGHGNFLFGLPGANGSSTRTGRSLRLMNKLGRQISMLDTYNFSWVDANKDGLTDVALSLLDNTYLFVNNGSSRFRQYHVPALSRTPRDMSYPVIANLSGSGNIEIAHTRYGRAYALALNGPETGLLTRVNDGKGTILDFHYERAKPYPGIGHRASVLSHVTIDSSGYDNVTHQYKYDYPIIHSEAGFLIGYSQVRKTSPVQDEVTTFYHDDDITSVLLQKEVYDLRTPDLSRFFRIDHEEVDTNNVRWLRERQRQVGWRSLETDEELVETTTISRYEKDRCAARSTHHGLWGETTVLRTFAEVSGMGNAWHCLVEREQLLGSPPSGTLFDELSLEQELVRNNLGQITRIYHHNDQTSLLKQELVYNSSHLLESIFVPGKGTTTVTYDKNTALPVSVVAPDGVKTLVENRNPLSDAIEALVSDRGATGIHRQNLRFDGLERLWKSWNDYDGSNAETPEIQLGYVFATQHSPGHIAMRELVDNASNSIRETVDYQTAAGDIYATAVRLGDRWAVNGITERSRSDLSEIHYRRSPLEEAEQETATYATLLQDTVYLGEKKQAGFGHVSSQHQVVQTNVERSVESRQLLLDGVLVTSTFENGDESQEIRTGTDAGGRVLWKEDASGARTSFIYDPFNRLVGVVLPDGITHRVEYDGFGRVALIERDGVGSIAYQYHLQTGFLERKSYFGIYGDMERTATYAYDDAGRVKKTRFELANTGESQEYRYFYDGQHNQSPMAGQKGFLTRVENHAYARTSEFNPDSSIRRTTWKLGNWREVEVSWTYNVDGSEDTMKRTVWDLATNSIIEETMHRYTYDTSGRIYQHLLDDKPFLTYTYNKEGLLKYVDINGSNQVLLYEYDSTTKRRNGYSQDTQLWRGGMHWQWNNRGLIASEELVLGEASWDRVYEYNARGFLTGSEDSQMTAKYAYAPNGLIERIGDARGQRSLNRLRFEMNVDGLSYRYDALGRVVARGDVEMEYGADGNLAVARRGGEQWEYIYDESGNRLMKMQGDTVLTAYVAGGYLDENGFVAPVRVDGHVIGILAENAFYPLLTDPRGTVLSESNGDAQIPTPYGARTERPEWGAAIDFVEKGYDADLGTVRFGVRDYDPYIGQWLTPDPLFLEQPEKCAESPLECNLYSYAGNNPANFTDPGGLCFFCPDPRTRNDPGNARLTDEQFESKYDLQAIEWALESTEKFVRLFGRFVNKLGDGPRNVHEESRTFGEFFEPEATFENGVRGGNVKVSYSKFRGELAFFPGEQRNLLRLRLGLGFTRKVGPSRKINATIYPGAGEERVPGMYVGLYLKRSLKFGPWDNSGEVSGGLSYIENELDLYGTFTVRDDRLSTSSRCASIGMDGGFEFGYAWQQ